MKFYYVSACWPGGVHDARVLRNSSIARKFESGWRPFHNAVILGKNICYFLLLDRYFYDIL